MSRQESETLVRDLLVRSLYGSIGEPGSMVGEGKDARFSLSNQVREGICIAEGKLPYVLPSGRSITHSSDILLSFRGGSHLSIEVKFLSAVSDQFKARSYSVLHLKQTHANRLSCIMVYLHMSGSGIGIDLARDYCYPFDQFIGLKVGEASKLLEADIWGSVVDEIKAMIPTPQ